MNSHIHHGVFQLMFALITVFGLFIYIFAVIVSNRSKKRWPLYRTIFWVFGIFCAAMAVVGPLANRAHIDFVVHMIGHLLLGMLAPLLMVLAAPMTLLLRTLNVTSARLLVRVLRSWPIRIISNPFIASVLNIGGLWVLYTTGLYVAMGQNMLVHTLVHIHVFLVGYLFTSAIIYIDPTPHRIGFVCRSVVLIITLAGHGILSKFIYNHPPAGIPATQAEMGGMLMYYGGDVIEFVLILILCLQWFRATRPRLPFAVSQ